MCSEFIGKSNRSWAMKDYDKIGLHRLAKALTPVLI